MIGNILLLIIVVMFGAELFILNKFLDKLTEIEKESKNDYRKREIEMEKLLAEEEYRYPEDEIEESLYKNDSGKYSYEAYAKNKRRKDAETKNEIFIDDFEEAAVKAERKNPYAR